MVKYNPKLGLKFIDEVEGWMRHCRANSLESDPATYINCQAYRNLVEIGEDVLPYIHEAVCIPEIRIAPIFGWSHLLEDIVGEKRYSVPTEIEENVEGLGLYVISWLKNNGDVLEDSLEYRRFQLDLLNRYDVVRRLPNNHTKSL